MAETEGPLVLPILEEHIRLGRRVVSTGKVRVQTRTETVEETARATLFEEAVEVRRIPKDQIVELAPKVRTEGDVTIIPVLEEVLVVETRLMLVEEIHVHRQVTSGEVCVPVILRKQRAVVGTLAPEMTTDHPLTKEKDITMAYETETSLAPVGATHRAITALFDSSSSANAAIEQLVAAGISRDKVRLLPGAESDQDVGSASGQTGGFWEGLKDLFLPDEDRHAYAEGLSRGGYLVSVETSDADYDRVADILDQEGTLDVDQQEAQWREGGWTGYTGTDYAGTGFGDTALTAASGTAGAAAIGSGPAGLSAVGGTAYEAPAPAPLSGGTVAKTQTATSTDDAVIPVAEETLRVGKREVNQGRVRIRSYVVETPVREDVSLREERVNVERRPVDRAVSATDELFRERTIELDQRSEEAVIAKDVRVTEEILLNKEVNQRTQTVSDSVRRTEVEVDDAREGGIKAGSFTASDTARIVEHMEVISADGQSVGRVDHLDGDRIKLTKNDSPDHEHHFVPLSWIDHVDQHVHLNKSLQDIKAGI